MKDYLFEIIQNGEVVATASCAKRKPALEEAIRYAMAYRLDGPVTVKETSPKDVSSVAIEFSHTPL